MKNILLIGLVVIVVAGGVLIFGKKSSSPNSQVQQTMQKNEQTNDSKGDSMMAPNAADSTMKKAVMQVGTSISPVDKGKSVASDQFKYTLLDVFEDTVDQVYGGYKVYLVKLDVERVALGDKQKPDNPTGLSSAEVDLATKINYERGVDTGAAFSGDIAYSRAKVGLALSEDVKSLKMGGKVTGYYIFKATTPENPKEIYFLVRNIGADSVGKGMSMKIAGSLRVK